MSGDSVPVSVGGVDHSGGDRHGVRSSVDDRGEPAGHDDRPARATMLLAGSVALLSASGLGIATGHGGATMLAVAGGTAFAGSVRLLDTSALERIAGGTVVAVGACCTLAFAAVGGPAGLATAISLASFGGVAGVVGATGEGRLLDGVGTVAYGTVPVLVTAVGLAFVGRFRAFAPELLSGVLSGGNGTALVGLAVLVTITLLALRSALRQLPLARLASGDSRERIRVTSDRLDRILSRALRIAAVSIPVAVVVRAVVETVAPRSSVASAIGTVAGTPVLRAPLLVVTVVAVAVTVGARTVRWVGGTVLTGPRRLGTTVAGTAVTVVLVAGAGRIVATIERQTGPVGTAVLRATSGVIGTVPTVLFAVWVTVVGVLLLGLLVPAMVGLGVIPSRASAPAIAAGSLLGAAVLAVGGAPAAIVLAAVVGAMVVWDLGEYAVGMGEEVGTATAPRAEAIHAAGSLGVGALVLGVATVVHALVTTVEVTAATGMAVLAAALVAAVSLVAILRG